jgi:hypothetical protein
MDDPKPGHCGRVKVFLDEKPDQAVALRSQHLVDLVGERQLGADVGPEIEHGLMGEMG